MQKNYFYLIDAHAFLHRSFHALPSLTANGEEVGALYGFVKMLTTVLQKQQPEFIAVCFDSKGGSTFRNELYPKYKANRPPISPALLPQLQKARTAAAALGLEAVFLDGWEADDIMATLARRACALNLNTVIVSGDKDICQLINSQVVAWDGSSADMRDENYVKNRYGLNPNAFADYLALLGDASDNVPGVAGIGEKSAVKLLHTYGSLEKIISASAVPAMVASDKLLQKFSKNIENARLSRKLVSLENDAPLGDIDFSKFRPRGLDTEEFRDFSSKYHFKILENMSAYTPAFEPKQFVEAEFEDVLNSVSSEIYIVYESGSITVASKNIAAFISSCSKENCQKILEILADKKVRKIVFALKDILNFVNADCNFSPSNFFDIEAAYRLLHFSTKKKTLAEILQDLFSFNKEQLNTEEKLANISAIHLLGEKLRKEAEETGQLNLLENIEFPLLSQVYAMEKYGIAVDRNSLSKLADKCSVKMSALQNKANELAECEINILSPKQVAFVLYEKFNPSLNASWRKQFKTKEGYSTSEEALLPLKDTNPLIPVILEYRELAKLKSSFIEPLLEASVSDGRVHTIFDQLGTSTGRFSSSKPNLQNIPVRSDNGQEVRQCFIASSGCVLLSADYSQIDLRVLAHLSGDKNFTEAFRAGEDIHLRTAAEIFDFAPEMVTPEMRRSAKAINFGIVYGQTAQGLATELGINRSEAAHFIKHYFEVCPEIKSWTEKTIEEAKLRGYVTTFAGRRRLLPELSSPNRNIRMFGERAAGNAPVQGGSAEIIKKAMLDVNKAFKNDEDIKLLLQVHDELIFEVKEIKLLEKAKIIKEKMEKAFSLSVPLVVEIKFGKNWREMQKINSL